MRSSSGPESAQPADAIASAITRAADCILIVQTLPVSDGGAQVQTERPRNVERRPVRNPAAGYSEDKDANLKRLRRIEGQIRGLQRMVEDDKYCIDILTQVAAANSALPSVAIGLLDEHVRHCVADADCTWAPGCTEAPGP